MKCPYCEKEIGLKDLHVSTAVIHHECFLKMHEEMEELKMIEIIGEAGTKMAYKLHGSFEDFFFKTLNDTRRHIIADETVDDDIVELQGVIKAVVNYLPKDLPLEKLFLYTSSLFNGFMSQKYGSPLPDEKKFNSRVKEFLEEVHSLPIREEDADYLKMIFKKERKWET